MVATYTSFGIDEGAEKQLLTLERGDVHAQGVFVAETGAVTYTVAFANISTAVANDHIVQVMGDGTNNTIIQRIWITQWVHATARTRGDFRIYRLSTAGTGGTVIGARPSLAADTDPYAGSCMTLPTAKGTEGNLMMYLPLYLTQSADNTMDNKGVLWERLPYTRGITIGTATTSGIAIKIVTAVAGATVAGEIEFSIIAEA